MRLSEIPGFVVYDLYNKQVFQRGKMHKLDVQRKEAALDEYAINTVIGLAGKIDPGLQQLDKEEVIYYFYYPIADGLLKKETIKQLETFAYDAAYSILNGGGAVLSYCNAGRNRSGLLNAMIIRELADCSGKEALEIVRRERPNAIANPHFEKFLLELP